MTNSMPFTAFGNSYIEPNKRNDSNGDRSLLTVVLYASPFAIAITIAIAIALAMD